MGDDDCGSGPEWSGSTDDHSGCDDRDDLAPSIPPDEVFEILADRRRRHALAHLRTDPQHVVELADLITCLAEEECGEDEDLSEVRRRIEADFHHNQLPKLVDSGVVDYDDRHESIRYVPAKRVERALKHFLD